MNTSVNSDITMKISYRAEIKAHTTICFAINQYNYYSDIRDRHKMNTSANNEIITKKIYKAEINPMDGSA